MNRNKILYYLKELSKTEELLHKANEIRKRYCGDEVHIRGIIEFSNYCSRNCFYCGLRKDNRMVKRYRMKEDEIVKLALHIASLGVKTIVLQSGDDFYYDRHKLCKILSAIKKDADVAITLCIGERPLGDYEAFKDAGADRYLLKHETATSELYSRLHPGQTLKRRLKILRHLKKLDYQVGAGNIVGLPGQNLNDLVEDILLLKKLDVDMAGIGPFIPQKDTPLGNFPAGNLDLTLRVLALTRIVTKNTHLPATTALATLDKKRGQLLGFNAGCNVIMPDFTPEHYRKSYAIYDNKPRIGLERAKEVILNAGRKISQNRGDSLKCR